jgi:hypothetical protein
MKVMRQGPRYSAVRARGLSCRRGGPRGLLAFPPWRGDLGERSTAGGRAWLERRFHSVLNRLAEQFEGERSERSENHEDATQSAR